jgi:hypothetical protein
MYHTRQEMIQNYHTDASNLSPGPENVYDRASHAQNQVYGVDATLRPTIDISSISTAKPTSGDPAMTSHTSQGSSPPSEKDSKSSQKAHLLSQRNDFLLDWTLKILGVASAILFGIWAPISFKLTADGNAGNDAAQTSLMSVQTSMMSEMSSLKVAQKSAADVLDNIGIIWAWEFCNGKDHPLCSDINSSASISEALSSLGGLSSTRVITSSTVSRNNTSPNISTATASRSSRSTATIAYSSIASGGGGNDPISTLISEGSPKDSSSISKNLLAIVLGCVFGGIVVIGLVVGVLVKRRQLIKLSKASRD